MSSKMCQVKTVEQSEGSIEECEPKPDDDCPVKKNIGEKNEATSGRERVKTWRMHEDIKEKVGRTGVIWSVEGMVCGDMCGIGSGPHGQLQRQLA